MLTEELPKTDCCARGFMLTLLEAGAAPLLGHHRRTALESRHLCICQAAGAVILGQPLRFQPSSHLDSWSKSLNRVSNPPVNCCPSSAGAGLTIHRQLPGGKAGWDVQGTGARPQE